MRGKMAIGTGLIALWLGASAASAVELTAAQQGISAFAFRLFDRDGDGAVTRAEADDQAKAIFALLDANRDGVLTKAELAALPPLGPSRGPITPRGFAMLDRNGDSVVSAAECTRFAAAQFARMDRDGDGRVSLAEARLALTAR